MARKRFNETWTGSEAPPVIDGVSGSGPRRRPEPSGETVNAGLAYGVGQAPAGEQYRHRHHRHRIGRRGLIRIVVTLGALVLVWLTVLLLTRR